MNTGGGSEATQDFGDDMDRGRDEEAFKHMIPGLRIEMILPGSTNCLHGGY